MNAEQVRQYLEYYRDLGVDTLYRRAATAPPAPGNSEGAGRDEPGGKLSSVSAAPEERVCPDILEPGVIPVSEPPSQIVTPARVAADASSLPPLVPEGETLPAILASLGDCRRCRLHEGRNKLVFGVGNEHAPLVFVGEGPGADEDAQGIPFVGRAGQLLTQMIEGTASKEGIPLKRDDVYICNVVKCRPPENRTPEPDEMEICGEFLCRQLSAIRPKAICALGGTAARAVTGQKTGVTKMRGSWYQWRDIPVMVTYHPSYLLRPYNANAKREAWEDLKKVLHFVFD
jgi:uracil-DNA glycosylase